MRLLSLFLAALVQLLFLYDAQACAWRVNVTNRETSEIKYFEITSKPLNIRVSDINPHTSAGCVFQILPWKRDGAFEKQDVVAVCAFPGTNRAFTAGARAARKNGGIPVEIVPAHFGLFSDSDINAQTVDFDMRCE